MSISSAPCSDWHRGRCGGTAVDDAKMIDLQPYPQYG
jgi:hypothetical protein